MPKKLNRNRLASHLNPGSAVEISSDEPGFRGSWYPGTVIRRSSDKNPTKYLVKYATLFFDKAGKKPLREIVDMNQLRPLPPPATRREKRERGFAVGEEVDAYYNDGWWEGVVTEVLDTGELSVFFRTSREQIQFRKDDLRLHSEWVNGAWKLPLDEEGAEEEEYEEDEEDGEEYKEDEEDEEEEDISTKVDPETVRVIAKQQFTIGTRVEVCSDEQGFEGSWFAARVIETLGEDKYLVEYENLRAEDGKEPLKEEIDFLHIRPPPPCEVDTDFTLGDKVDAYYNDGWWEGVVTEISRDRRFSIFFTHSREKLRFGRQGLRLHREWINGNWELPPKGEKKKAKKVSHKGKVRYKKATAKQEFSSGTLVEVGSEEEGFEGSWFAAKIVEARGKDKYLVEYEKLKAEDGIEPLREEINVLHIRPQPPETVIVGRFDKSDKVDALYNDGWWVGEISKVLSNSMYLVHFEKTGELLKFDHSHLRLHQDCIDGKWVTSS